MEIQQIELIRHDMRRACGRPRAQLVAAVAPILIFRRSIRSATFCEPSEKRCVVSYICTAPWSIPQEPIIGE
jgi:hypothetical protein